MDSGHPLVCLLWKKIEKMEERAKEHGSESGKMLMRIKEQESEIVKLIVRNAEQEIEIAKMKLSNIRQVSKAKAQEEIITELEVQSSKKRRTA